MTNQESVVIVKIEGTCQFEGCSKPAEYIACGRESFIEEKPGHPNAACYCEEHMSLIVDERFPEYSIDCPNCGCRFGVN
jgi:hypothetical protein